MIDSQESAWEIGTFSASLPLKSQVVPRLPADDVSGDVFAAPEHNACRFVCLEGNLGSDHVCMGADRHLGQVIGAINHCVMPLVLIKAAPRRTSFHPPVDARWRGL